MLFKTSALFVPKSAEVLEALGVEVPGALSRGLATGWRGEAISFSCLNHDGNLVAARGCDLIPVEGPGEHVGGRYYQ